MVDGEVAEREHHETPGTLPFLLAEQGVFVRLVAGQLP